jgi:hypothetical protein
VQTDSVIIGKILTIGQVLEGGLIEALRPYVLAFKYKQVTFPPVDYRKTDITDRSPGKDLDKVITAGSGNSSGEWGFWLGLLALGLIIVERIWPKRKK